LEGKPQNRIQKVRADEIGRQIQAYALYCGISPTGSNSIKGVLASFDDYCFLLLVHEFLIKIQN